MVRAPTCSISISDILDLSKIESGHGQCRLEEILFANLLEKVERSFRHEADNRKLSFEIAADTNLGRSMATDSKAPAAGAEESVVECFQVHRTWRCPADGEPGSDGLESRSQRLEIRGYGHRFRGFDTGVVYSARKTKDHFRGLPAGRRSTSRKYGGTGLGLAISRELANCWAENSHCAALRSGKHISRYIAAKAGEAVAPGRSRSTNPYR